MFIRIVLIAFCFASVACAQDASEPKRFKYEKHGAIVFASGKDYEIKCDIYQPISDEPRPVMLAIHGGAWTTGSKFAMLRHARILANRGYVVMSINYRLAPQHKWPAQIHDCKHAVRWIREHADKYNADPDHVYAFGYSAGGHLASLLATADEDDGLEGDVVEPYAKHSSRIDGLIAGGSPMEFSWVGDDSTVLKHWMGETKKANPEIYAQASPVTFVTSDDPVAVLFHGKADGLVPISSPEAFIESYRAANIEAELIVSVDGHTGAFGRTSLLIESLQKLESMLAVRKCKDKMAQIVEWMNQFQQARKRKPVSFEELAKFVLRTEKISAEDFAIAVNNERDGQDFVVRWGAGSGSLVTEAVGVDGKKLSK